MLGKIKTLEQQASPLKPEDAQIMQSAPSNSVEGEVSNYVTEGTPFDDFSKGMESMAVTGYPEWPPKPTAAAQEMSGGAMVFSDRLEDEIHAATVIREKTPPSENEKTEARNNLVAQMNSSKEMSMGRYWVDKEATRAVIEKYNYWLVKTNYNIVYDKVNKKQINSIKAVKEVLYLGYGIEATEPGNNNIRLGTWNKYTGQLMNVDHDRTFAANDLSYKKSTFLWTFPVGTPETLTAGTNYQKAIFKEGKGFVDHTIAFRFSEGGSIVGEVFLSEMMPIIEEHEKNVKHALGADDDTKANISLVLGWASSIVGLIPGIGDLAAVLMSESLGTFSTIVGMSAEDTRLINESRTNSAQKATNLANKSSMGAASFSYVGNSVFPK